MSLMAMSILLTVAQGPPPTPKIDDVAPRVVNVGEAIRVTIGVPPASADGLAVCFYRIQPMKGGFYQREVLEPKHESRVLKDNASGDGDPRDGHILYIARTDRSWIWPDPAGTGRVSYQITIEPRTQESSIGPRSVYDSRRITLNGGPNEVRDPRVFSDEIAVLDGRLATLARVIQDPACASAFTADLGTLRTESADAILIFTAPATASLKTDAPLAVTKDMALSGRSEDVAANAVEQQLSVIALKAEYMKQTASSALSDEGPRRSVLARLDEVTHRVTALQKECATLRNRHPKE